MVISLYIGPKIQPEIKTSVYNTLGKLSYIVSKGKFEHYIHSILKIIKQEFDKNSSSLCLQIFEFLANSTSQYATIILAYINYEEIITKMFNVGFYEAQCQFLIRIMQHFDKNSTEHLNILISVLNVIAIIISERKFNLDYSTGILQGIKYSFDFGTTMMDINETHEKESNAEVSVSNLPLANNSQNTDMVVRERKYSYTSKKTGKRDFLNSVRKSILNYLVSIKTSSKQDSNRLYLIMLRNSLAFLRQIENDILAKDILTFYHKYCLKYLEDPNESLKRMCFSLANSKWIPDYRYSSIDATEEYILNNIADSFLNVLLNDSNDELKEQLITLLDDRYNKILSSVTFFNKITLVLNCYNNSLKEKVVALIGRLLPYNFTPIIIYIKKSILEIFNNLDLCYDLVEKEDAVILLSYYVKFSGKYIMDYVELILSTLIKILKSKEEEDNDTLSMSILNIVSELITNVKNPTCIKEEYYKVILERSIGNMKDNSNSVKQEISLKAILCILEHSNVNWKIYYEHPTLVNELIQLLIKDSTKVSRDYALRIFGFIGAMDNENLEKIWSIHKIENSFLNENYDVEEYQNFDKNIIDHQKKQIKKLSQVDNRITVGKNTPDFKKLIEDQELDPCTYYAVWSLMKILKVENQETGIHVIAILSSLIKSLQDNEAAVVEIILPTLLDTLDRFEAIYTRAIFDNFLLILSNFRTKFLNYLSQVLNTIERYINNAEFQSVVFNLLKKILEEFPEQMKSKLPHWIPLLVSLLVENNNPLLKSRNPFMNLYIFQCFAILSENLANYLPIIIPEVLRVLSINEPPSHKSSINSSSSMQSPNLRSSNKNDDYLSKDELIINFFDSIILLPRFVQFLPKVINGLLKCFETNSQNWAIQEAIIKLFLKMASYIKKDFVIFLPSIIKTTKSSNLPLNVFYREIKGLIDKEDITEELIGNENAKGQLKKSRVQDDPFYFEKEALDKNRKSQMDKKLLMKEFNPSNCSIEEDWREWFKSSSKTLFEQSPSYAIYYCHNVADYHLPLHTELYKFAFISCWRNLNDIQKTDLIEFLNITLNSSKAPNDILLTILNLSEYIEREENIEFIEFSTLGIVAHQCKAYAKALYYKENDFRYNLGNNSYDELISLYYDLKLPEAAYGILLMANNKQNKNSREDDWYIKLQKWETALQIYDEKLQSDKKNPDLIKGKLKCMEGLSDWENLIDFSEEVDQGNDTKDYMTKFSPILARACMNLGEWDKLRTYIDKIEDEAIDEDNFYEKNFFSSVLSIKEERYSDARVYIETCRNVINEKVKTLLSESYERAYNLLLQNQHLYELEELISFKTGDSNMSKERLVKNWEERLEIVCDDGKDYERILSIRSLVFDIEEDLEKYLKFAKIMITHHQFGTCLNVLNRLDKKLTIDKPDARVRIQLTINKCLYANNKREIAIENIQRLISSTDQMEKLSDNIKSYVYSTLCKWKIKQASSSSLEKPQVDKILEDLVLSTKYDSSNYHSWHFYGLLNYMYYEQLKNNTLGVRSSSTNVLNLSSNSEFKVYALNAIIGFTHAVCIGGNNISRVLQDLLRIIEIWFSTGHDEDISIQINKAFELASVESWMLVIPQMLARVNIVNEKIKASMSALFKRIGNSHPRALIYPLNVMAASKNKKRREAAERFLNNIQNKKLISECSLIIRELNRCAMLLHEEWAEAIEEAAKQYFQANDINGMIKSLMEVHEKMDRKPETMNEIHFHQLYYSDLIEAKEYLKRYLDSKNEMDLKQSWDIYHSVYRHINDTFQTMNFIDMENVSPKLSNFYESEICMPGLYKVGHPVIKITGFQKNMSVFSSKQHPRKIIIYGSDGKEYTFLLKGHEDLRQDESVMQLFGLVNTLLANDQDTSRKNLFIKRFPVIPLSQNTGIIGWVPNCDTLHQLIKEHRASIKVNQNVEHRTMFEFCPKFETLSFLNKLEVFKLALSRTMGIDLYRVLWKKSKNSEAWLDRRTNYSRSLAVMSMVGYILGLGDRHPSNLMLDRNSGKIIHIDFGDCFEVAMKREKFPEKVPFRLTRMLIKALEISGIEGTFRLTCENVMRVLRANKDSLVAILAAFVHDPLISFRILIPLILKAQRKSLNGEANQPEQNGVHKNERKSITRSSKRDSQLKLNFEKYDEYEENRGRRKIESAERLMYNQFEERGSLLI